MKRVGDFLLEKDFHAMIAALVFSLLPLFYIPTGFLAAIIVGLVTLSKGPKAGAFVLAWVALPAVASLVMQQLTPFDVLFLRCVVIWLLAIGLRKYQSWGLMLELMAMIGVILIIGLHLTIPDLKQWWINELTRYVNEMFTASEWKMNVKPDELVSRLAPIATGVVSFFFACSVLVELLLARFWQLHLKNSRLFAEEFATIRIGRFAAMLALGMSVLLLFQLTVAIDVFPLILLPFFVAGLSLMHQLVHLKRSLFALLIALYIGLFFLPVFVVSALAAIGFMDSWSDFRKKVIK